MHHLKKHFALFGVLVITLLFSACAGNGSVPNSISALSSNDPQLGFWAALKAEDNKSTADRAYTAEISFGTCARNLERFTVAISSEDFEITKNCPDEYVVDGVEYSDKDFYVIPSSEVLPEDLPQKFTISLTPISGKELYKGTVEVTITEYMLGGHGTATVVLYYYGDSDLVCFSSNSLKEAESIFTSRKS